MTRNKRKRKKKRTDTKKEETKNPPSLSGYNTWRRPSCRHSERWTFFFPSFYLRIPFFFLGAAAAAVLFGMEIIKIKHFFLNIIPPTLAGASAGVQQFISKSCQEGTPQTAFSSYIIDPIDTAEGFFHSWLDTVKWRFRRDVLSKRAINKSTHTQTRTHQ